MEQPVLYTSHLGSVVKVNSSPVEDLKQGLRLLESFRGKELSILEENQLRHVAGLGYSEAQRELGRYFLLKPKVKEVELAEACQWLQLAMLVGDLDAKVMLARCYYRGSGVPKNDYAAAELYRQASHMDHPVAQYYLGIMCGRGEGVTQSYVEAYRWIRLSASKHFGPALSSLKTLEGVMTPTQIKEAKLLADEP